MRDDGDETTTSGGYRAVSVALFLCLFASQAAVIAMSPVLADAASDLHVSTAAAGQLRTITGLAAGITALMLGAVAGRLGLGRQLLAASALLALGSLASAAAPSFALLALAQLPVGVAVAVLTTAGTLAAAEWVSPELRTRTLSWALVGQPAAWIVGMPLIGLLGERSWRYGWLALPLAAAVVAGILVASRAGAAARTSAARARSRRARRPHPRALAGVRAARERRLGGNARLRGRALRRVVRDLHQADRLPARASRPAHTSPATWPAGASSATSHGESSSCSPSASPSPTASSGLRARTSPRARPSSRAPRSPPAARTLVASAFALATAPDLRPAVTSLRAATMQFGYFAGSIAGGAALAVGGYGALGATMGLFFLGAAATLVHRPTLQRTTAERAEAVTARPPCAVAGPHTNARARRC